MKVIKDLIYGDWYDVFGSYFFDYCFSPVCPTKQKDDDILLFCWNVLSKCPPLEGVHYKYVEVDSIPPRKPCNSYWGFCDSSTDFRTYHSALDSDGIADFVAECEKNLDRYVITDKSLRVIVDGGLGDWISPWSAEEILEEVLQFHDLGTAGERFSRIMENPCMSDGLYAVDRRSVDIKTGRAQDRSVDELALVRLVRFAFDDWIRFMPDYIAAIRQRDFSKALSDMRDRLSSFLAARPDGCALAAIPFDDPEWRSLFPLFRDGVLLPSLCNCPYIWYSDGIEGFYGPDVNIMGCPARSLREVAEQLDKWI